MYYLWPVPQTEIDNVSTLYQTINFIVTRANSQ